MQGILERRLSRAEAAARVRAGGQPCEQSTLAKEATYGSGPPYVIIGGRAFYAPGDVDAWAQSRVSAPIRKASDARRHPNEAAA